MFGRHLKSSFFFFFFFRKAELAKNPRYNAPLNPDRGTPGTPLNVSYQPRPSRMLPLSYREGNTGRTGLEPEMYIL